ncbi:polysaccharide biosynthesis C-terminal domain-containing protein [Maribacter sp. 1_MG-2023]|uniref:polysaccharide biosynthesis C-terminal domain-containing protein n=1 Tax=Maribacter sp. 1_MG-2023 TaxID=3062677 RepID=UPI0026E408CF|nr:polysaccharide biosynthesis C-terminal domain-containing protein [Maribacter sp. 1_MG-2023]MDO6471580.1 polysaccharide biosynthesis C-terminal domain-containing protein [Maribacter sp. 1_MG-2023]
MKNSLESLFTRGISIASKFLLLGYLAKNLSLDDYGSFQLISYFVLISTTIFGLEYYNITNRNIAQATEKKQIYNEHFSFFVTIAPFVLIAQVLLFLIVFPNELITSVNVVLVLVIGLCDYFSQEVYRYLMINKSFRKGNIQLIYKSLLFVLLIVVYDIFFEALTFEIVLWIMLVSYILLFIIAYKGFVGTLHKVTNSMFRRMSSEQLKLSLKAILPFVVLILFLKGIEFSDKFIIGKVLSLEDTGIYSFLFSIASVIHIFIVSGFYIIYLPQLIQSFADNKNIFISELKKFGLLTLVSSITLAVVIPFISPFIFSLIDKEAFIAHIDLLYIFLLGFVFNNLSLIPHLFLYVSHDEKAITVIMAVSFVINLGLNLVLIPKFGILGAAYSFVITYFTVLVLKLLRAQIKWREIKV